MLTITKRHILAAWQRITQAQSALLALYPQGEAGAPIDPDALDAAQRSIEHAGAEIALLRRHTIETSADL